MTTAMRYVNLIVYSADNLRETGFTKQDPYCVVEVGEKTFKTKPDNSAGPHPVWNEELRTEVPATVDTARITIYNKNTLRKDDVIGIATVRLSDLKGVEQSIPVYDKDGNRHGDLRVFGNYGSEPGVAGTGRGGAGATNMGTGGTAYTGAGAAGHHPTAGQTGMHAGAGTAAATGAAAGTGVGAAEAHRGAGTGVTGAHTGAAAAYTDANTGAAGTRTGPGAAPTMGERVKEHVPGTAEHKATHGHGTGMGAGYTSAVPATEGAQHGSRAGKETFTVMEDRPVTKERKELFTEHRPVEREMVRELRTTGKEVPHPVTRDPGQFQEQVLPTDQQ